MTYYRDLLIDIENMTASVGTQLGWETVKFVFREYGGGASSVKTLHPRYYESVWNALFDYEIGMKD